MTGASEPDPAFATCAGCGCVCDDIPVTGPPYRTGEPNVDTECSRGREWFATRVFGRTAGVGGPTVDGAPADLDDAVARSADLLASARHPVVAGLSHLSLEAQRKVVEIADRAGADIDTRRSSGHLGTVLAVQRTGGAFLTLGEIRERTDCLVLWYVRPDRTHPRFLERFYPRGSRTGQDRELVAVGPDAEEVGADTAVSVGPDQSLSLLWLLRLLAADPETPEAHEDPLAEHAARLLRVFRQASHGAVLYDGEPSDERADPVETAGIFRLLDELGDRAPWGARPLREEGNPAGAEAALAWQSGYPAAVTFRWGPPRYAGTTYSGADVLASGDVDLLLLAGGDPAVLPLPSSTPCIWLDTGASLGESSSGSTRAEASGGDSDGEEGAPSSRATVRIPVLPLGATEGETVLRMDGLPVRSPGLREFGRGGRTAEEVTGSIARALAQPANSEGGGRP